MRDILLTIFSGIIATGVMSASLYAIHWRGFANADMIRAVGSLVTRNEERALVPGLVIHFTMGIVFALIYVAFWSRLPVDSAEIYLALGAGTGFAHGLVVSFALVILVAEHHPVERYQQAGMGVAVAHLLSHVIFGIVVGWFVSRWGLHFSFMSTFG